MSHRPIVLDGIIAAQENEEFVVFLNQYEHSHVRSVLVCQKGLSDSDSCETAYEINFNYHTLKYTSDVLHLGDYS